ncbi:imm11 family protein [Neptunomonas antarctica]|uniref:Immunity MXAN-0049 protein domain-containing protein n=1 Tax=Neptunomonas antarctica TaxID=619304 RepID=A0A1N7IUN9_9GAMM|nr:DUF1629 domain-containing protein [Neptunomonas antarctica]SIS40760.1 hypothetical protein SAMN05421760_101153 [Neptunomonas antarctica]
MEYLQVKQITSGHNLVYAEATAKWFLRNDDRSVRKWAGLASLRFYQDPDILPTSPIPVIHIEDYKGEEARFDESYTLPEGRLLDLFKLGIYYFVSSRLKRLLEEEAVEAYFTEAAVTIKGERYPEPYYLLAPRDMLAVFDENNAVFKTEVDLGGELKIRAIEKYALLEDAIPANQKLFYVYINGGSPPLMLRSDIVKKVQDIGMTGIKYTPLDEMKRI